MKNPVLRVILLAIVGCLLAAGPSAAQLTADPVLKKCDNVVASALKSCFSAVSARLRKCYLADLETCPANDAPIANALAKVATKVTAACSTANLQALGYGPTFTQAGMIARLQEACRGNAEQIVARTFGGPQASLLQTPSAEIVTCLSTAYKQSTSLIKSAFGLQSACARKAHKGATCDPASVSAKIALKQTAAQNKITFDCPPVPNIEDLVGLNETRYTDSALEQSRCMTATAHADVGPLSLDCGPRPSVPVPARGVWTQVVLDSNTYGTKCGDGSPYAFWLRLAPAGQPVEKVIINLQGGGVCIFENSPPACATTSPDLFEAQNDYQPSGPTGGWLSTNPVDNPFSDYTMIALPYCTQDVFFGGGVADVFSPSLTVYRYGAVNTRATLRYLRDVLWAEMDATTTDGFRPDLLRPLFGGESAGGYGVSYNYHYLLDDLRWTHTTAVPDSGLALDNGGIGVLTLGGIVSNPSAPSTYWAPRPFQPPYCLSSSCAAITQVGNAITAVRLKAVPEQQVLTTSNQVDNTQQSTTFFGSSAAWTNAARAGYCANQGLNGIHYFLPAHTGSIHTMLQTTSQFTGLTADGITVRDWLANAVADPDGVVDAVEEGTLVTDIPGVNPFSCSILP